MLLNAGADIHATAQLYGDACTTLGLAATSVHPERAGVQEALLEKLLAHGAAIDDNLVNICLANGRGQAAAFLARRGARLDLAAALGLGSFTEGAALESATQEQWNEGFLFACEYGRNAVVEHLIAKHVDIAVQDCKGQTGLHRAVIGGQLDTVKLLLKHHAPLEITNSYGGTILGQALWSAAREVNPNVYTPIIETLVAAGALPTE